MSTVAGAVVRVDLLGPLQAWVTDDAVTANGAKLRAVVARLALADGRIVSVDDLLDAIWGEALPLTARNSLQHHIGVLRKSLACHGAADILVTRDPGYALSAVTDVTQFLQGAAAAARAAAQGRPEEAADAFAAALNLWRGHALADLREFEFASTRAIALEEQRLTCLEAWADAGLACGRDESLLSPLQDLVAENPTRERLWGQLMLALYRTGRQDAALSAYRAARAILDRELGVTPTARLTSLHRAILAHDPLLQPAAVLVPRPARLLTSTTLVRSELAGTPPTLVGPGGRRVVLAGASVVLGRHAECDLVLADDQASRQHARVEKSGGAYVVVDLGSTNGTFLNGIRLDGVAVLAHGDRIEVGHSVVRFATDPNDGG